MGVCVVSTVKLDVPLLKGPSPFPDVQGKSQIIISKTTGNIARLHWHFLRGIADRMRL